MTTSRLSVHGWREWRRLRAWELAQQGWGVRRVAVALDASPAAVSRWLATARHGGHRALLARSRPGTPPKLRPDQRRLIPDFLWHGPEAYGFRGELWTCPRAVQVLAEEFGVSYSRSQVARILKALGWTPHTQSG
jgi:transposase